MTIPMFRLPIITRNKPIPTPERGGSRKVVILTDGAITPERAGAGAVAHDEQGFLLALANRVLPRMTNNEAEYAGLMLALEIAVSLKRSPVEICMDSEVVVYQMIGRFAVNSPALKVWHRKACVLARTIPGLSYRCIPREQNRLADALAADVIAGRLWCLESTERIKP